MLELVKQCRSYRRFKEDAPLTQDQLTQCVNAARFTASSVNMQPLKYYISTDRETNKKIFLLTKWARLLKDYPGPHEGERPAGYVVICCDKQITPNTDRFLVDVGIAAQTIVLSACEMGIASCMIGNFDPEKLLDTLGTSGDRFYPYLILAFGIGDETIVLEEMGDPKAFAYYRDTDGVHHVPKRPLREILIK